MLKRFLKPILIIVSFFLLCGMKSSDEEIKIGEKAAHHIESEFKLIKDEVKVNRVITMGSKIAEKCGRKDLNFVFKIIEMKGEVNAFALPGGFIYVSNYLLDFVRTDDELAGVLAHEIAHINFKHSLKQLSKMEKMSLYDLLAIILSKDIGVATMANLISIARLNRYSIEYEQESDHNAINYLRESGYNPVGILTFMERLNKIESLRAEIEPGIFQTHPYTEERVNYILEDLKRLSIKIDRRKAANLMPVVVRETEIGGKRIAEVLIENDVIFRIPSNLEGKTPIMRAKEAKEALDKLIDDGVKTYEIETREVGKQSMSVVARNATIIIFYNQDALFYKRTLEEFTKESAEKLKKALWIGTTL